MGRLLFIVYALRPAGMERQLLHLATGLAQRGHEVTVLCTTSELDTAQLTGAMGRLIELGPLDRGRRLTAVPSIARIARRYDLVHCTGWDASLWGRLAGLLARRPVVVTEHSTDRFHVVSEKGASRGRVVAWHHRLLSPFTYATVVVAEPQLALLEADGVKRDRLVHIPNGVPLEVPRPSSSVEAIRAGLGIPAHAKVVVHVARFHALKRQRLTYAAVRDARTSLGEDVRAVFVGYRSELADELEARAHREGATWVHILGVRDDVPSILAGADLAVLPSTTEALPMAMIEAMALGVPLVATDVGAMGSVLRASGAGRVVAPDDEDGFIAACRQVLSDPALAKRLGSSGRVAARGFSADAMLDRYSTLFEAAIARPRQAPPHITVTEHPIEAPS